MTLPGLSLVTRLSKHSYDSLTLIIISSFTAREYFSLCRTIHTVLLKHPCVFYYLVEESRVEERSSAFFFYYYFEDVIRSFINLSVSTSVFNWFSSCHSLQNEQIKSVFLRDLCTVCMLTPWWHSLNFTLSSAGLQQHWHTQRWVVIMDPCT